MENIIKIIYDKSIKNEFLNINDIETILELLIVNKSLNNYILNLNIQPAIRSNNLASYSNHTKEITLYKKTIEQMTSDIKQNIITASDFEFMLYNNLSILQVLLHEVEHANQQKIAYSENTLEAFIIRLSFLVDSSYNEQLYECNPEERLSEIKSYQEIINLLNYINYNLDSISKILNIEEAKKLLRGYHYREYKIANPIVTYFTLANKEKLLYAFDWYQGWIKNNTLDKFKEKYTLNERLEYGFPIYPDEYKAEMKKLVLSLDKYFKKSIYIIT